MVDITLLVFFLVSTAIQLDYLFNKFNRLNSFSSKRKMTPPGVSIIVAAKNEYENLQKHLAFVLQQDYPNFEVIVVDDSSTDDSLFLLKKMEGDYQNLKVLNLTGNQKGIPGKKGAITEGVRSAKFEWLLFTDADCRPMSRDWIKSMMINCMGDVEIVLGASPYIKKQTFLNKLIRMDTIIIAINYLSFAIKGNPYMGVGRNLLYKKKLFYEANGFESHKHIPSGDDDLFIHQVSTKNNTSICLDEKSIVFSEPKLSSSAFFEQKRRHFGTAGSYTLTSKMLLITYPLSLAFFYLLALYILMTPFWWISFILLLMRSLVFLRVIAKPMKLLNGEDLLTFSPFFEILIYLVNFIIYISRIFVKNDRWR